MGSLGDELTLGSICGFPRKASKIMNVAEYVKKLEEEMRKIEAYKLELPLCLEILNDAISYLKEENKRCSEMDTQPFLKNFISLTKPITEEIDGIEMQLLKKEEMIKENKFQLWKANDHTSNQRFLDTNIKNKLDIERSEEKSSNSLSMSLMRTPRVETGLGLGLTSSSMVNGRRKGIASCDSTSSPMPQPTFLQQQQALRKQRRCWTPELHRRFVDALQQLGGPGEATPKQIREHMQEEGLTNDEVKSHLQKYRLHMRKSNSNPEKQSAVVLGFNLWNSSQDEETSKRSNSQSASPQGPLQLPATTTTTTTGGDSSMEDTEDAKSESFQMERLRSP